MTKQFYLCGLILKEKKKAVRLQGAVRAPVLTAAISIMAKHRNSPLTSMHG